MKILYDHQIYTDQKFGGISRYFTQIIENLPSNIQSDISVKYSDNEYLKNSHIVPNIESKIAPYRRVDKMLWGVKFRGKKRILNLTHGKAINQYIDSWALNKQYSIEKLKHQDFDIFHPTYYDNYFLDYIGKKPFVLTIHDMIHELYPEIQGDMEIIQNKHSLAEKASHIIAVSEKTKQDIIDILKIPEKKISVIYHANSLKSSPLNLGADFKIPQKYILFVGERGGYKNFLFTVMGLEATLKENPELFVLCTGNSFSEKEELIMRNLNIYEKFISLAVDDTTLAELYKKALCLIFPSYYEGFGIPILEAFSLGCPVVLSDTSCFPEIAQNAAIYFNPKDINQISQAIRKLITNHSLVEEIIEKGFKRNAEFTWELSAQKTNVVYEKVLSEL